MLNYFIIPIFIILFILIYLIIQNFIVNKNIYNKMNNIKTKKDKKQSHGFGKFKTSINKILNLESEYFTEIRADLNSAGFFNTNSIYIYIGISILAPFIISYISYIVLKTLETSELNIWLSSGFSFVLVIYISPKIIKQLIVKRNENILKSLPDALDLMLISAQSGLSIDAILKKLVATIGENSIHLAKEFDTVISELTFLPTRADAFYNLMRRIKLDEIKSVATALLQSEQYGTPVAKSLKSLSLEFRKQRLMKAEEKAAKLATTLTIPLVLFVLPVMFIILLGPALRNASSVWG
jgi:tight adherence protein C